jgi:type II secretory pathway component PulJ
MVLFEVIIALSVFALVAMSLVMALDVSMDSAWRREKIEGALRGLENQMAQLHNMRLGPGENDLPDDGSGFTYSIAVEQAQFKDQKNVPLNGIYRVTVTAKWKDGSEDESRDLSELFYQP